MVHGHDWASVVIDMMKGPQLEVKGHKQAAADSSPAGEHRSLDTCVYLRFTTRYKVFPDYWSQFNNVPAWSM